MEEGGVEATRLAPRDQTGATRAGRAGEPPLRLGSEGRGFLSPSRAGGVVRSEFPGVRGGRVPGGRGVAAAAGGSRLSLSLSLGSGVGDGGVEAASSARLSVSRRRRLKNWKLETRASDLPPPPPPPPRRGRRCRRPEPEAPRPGEPGGGRAGGPGGRVGNGADPGAGSPVSRRRQGTTFLRFSPRGWAPAVAPDAAAAAAAAALPAAALLPALRCLNWSNCCGATCDSSVGEECFIEVSN